MRKFVLFGAMLILFLGQLAVADPINPVNARPGVEVAAPSAGEPSLQSILDQIYGGGVNAATDQRSAGMWNVLTNQDVLLPQLRFEYAGLAADNSIGIFFGNDSNSITKVPIFFGAATGKNDGGRTLAVLQWADDGSLVIDGINGKVNVGSFVGIPYFAFGFYLAGPNGTVYSVDQLNGGAAQVLAYQDPGPDLWTLAFEDSPTSGAPGDYNDAIVTVESVLPVPEPASMVLLGTGLVGLGGVLRRKHSRKAA